MNLKNQKDFFSGLLFMAAGLSFAWSAPRYTVGTAADMGPGYVSLLLGAVLTLLGGVVVFKALVFETEDGGRIGAWAWQTLAWVVLTNLALGWVLDRWAPFAGRDVGAAFTKLKLLPLLTGMLGALGPVEAVALMVLCLMVAVVLASGTWLKAVAMGVLGLLLGLVGTSMASDAVRFALDLPELAGGIGFVALAIGVLGYGDRIRTLASHRRMRQTAGARRVGRWFFPALVFLYAVGVGAIRGSTFDLWLLTGCALVGHVFRQLDMQPAPLLLGFVLGPLMEDKLRSALQFADGDWSVFVSRPLSAGLLLGAVGLLLLAPIVRSWRPTTWKRR